MGAKGSNCRDDSLDAFGKLVLVALGRLLG